MSKNIVVCLDGTWNDSVFSKAPPTNIHWMFHSGSLSNQFKNYYPGVGSRKSWFGKWIDGATGRGVFQTVREAWTHIAANYQNGDRIFIFGFSRGAYAARQLASMIVRKGLDNRQGKVEFNWAHELDEVHPAVLQEVHFLGLFDCVPGNQLYMLFDRRPLLNAGTLEKGILHFRHAVSRDELRWTFRPLLFQQNGQMSFAQHWFPGFHSDVGGGSHAGGLASFSLWWMLREAYERGLDFDNIECRSHKYGHALNVIQSADPEASPVNPGWWTTRHGFLWDRRRNAQGPVTTAAPRFEDLDTCPLCGHDMFDYFLTIPGKRWLRAKGLIEAGIS